MSFSSIPAPGHPPRTAALQSRWNPRTAAGYSLIAGSFALWLPLPLLPFLSLPAAGAAGLVGGLVIAAELAFWAGVVLAGPEAARRLRGALGRWRRGRPA